jgi:DNA-directed RNA polymerase specialized sigma24 family protein
MTIDPVDELFERLNAGDLSAAERVFLACEPYLRMAVRRRLSGPLRAKLDSRDVVQSVWADVLSRCRDSGWRFNDRSHFRAFLVKAARNRLIERHRQHHRSIEREQSLEETAPEELPRANHPRPSEIAQQKAPPRIGPASSAGTDRAFERVCLA